MSGRFARCAPVLAAALLVVLSGCARTADRGDRSSGAAAPLPHADSTTHPRPSTNAPQPSTAGKRVTSTQRAPEGQAHASAVPHLPARTSAASRSGALPLSYSTGSASQLVTVTASNTSTAHATLQTWTRHGSNWVKVDAPVHAWLGTQGLTSSMSEFIPATPMGSFTLTQAFGRLSNPGTALPYFKTTPADWWISQAGPKYNTHQRCASNCSFTQGDPNEHLYYEIPYYNYAIVIDYNTRNAGPVRQNAGSAVFLHVTVGKPTAGCVSIPQDQLVRILEWLEPSAHPRILIGVGRAG